MLISCFVHNHFGVIELSFRRGPSKRLLKYKAAKCPHCGMNLLKDIKLCPRCDKDPDKFGKKHDTEFKQRKKECLGCKTLNEPGNVVCSGCGINFVAREMDEPLDFSALRTADKKRKND